MFEAPQCKGASNIDYFTFSIVGMFPNTEAKGYLVWGTFFGVLFLVFVLLLRLLDFLLILLGACCLLRWRHFNLFSQIDRLFHFVVLSFFVGFCKKVFPYWKYRCNMLNIVTILAKHFPGDKKEAKIWCTYKKTKINIRTTYRVPWWMGSASCLFWSWTFLAKVVCRTRPKRHDGRGGMGSAYLCLPICTHNN